MNLQGVRKFAAGAFRCLNDNAIKFFGVFHSDALCRILWLFHNDERCLQTCAETKIT